MSIDIFNSLVELFRLRPMFSKMLKVLKNLSHSIKKILRNLNIRIGYRMTSSPKFIHSLFQFNLASLSFPHNRSVLRNLLNKGFQSVPTTENLSRHRQPKSISDFPLIKEMNYPT